MKQRFETLAVHAGHTPDDLTRARAVPLHRTTSYTFRDARHAIDLFSLAEPGFLYSRMGNPTQEVLENRLAALEGGKAKKNAAALALASGTSAVFYAIINLARQGDEIVAARNLYGGTFTMLEAILPQMGIAARFVDPGNLGAFAAAITPKTRAVLVEAIGNPTLEVADIAALADLAHAHGLPLIVDSTFATPYLLRPLEFGADIVVHSLTKWIGGHGTAIGGVVVDGNTFDWKRERFALFHEPDESYHGLRWAHDDLGGLPPYITRMRTVPLRNLGACISADNAWIFLQGLETLPLRMDRHSSNALTAAEYLAKHPKVAWVRYPGLEGDPAHSLAKRYLPKGAGGMVVFGMAAGNAGAGRAAGHKFVENLRLFSHLANVGDAKSLALHPAGTTHSQLSERQQRDSGIRPEMVRLSIGIEHPEDILEDIEQALSRVDGL